MLRSHDLLKGFMELTESCYSHDYWLLQGKDIDLSQPRKEHIQPSLGKYQTQSILCPLFMALRHIIFSASVCDST